MSVPGVPSAPAQHCRPLGRVSPRFLPRVCRPKPKPSKPSCAVLSCCGDRGRLTGACRPQTLQGYWDPFCPGALGNRVSSRVRTCEPLFVLLGRLGAASSTWQSEATLETRPRSRHTAEKTHRTPGVFHAARFHQMAQENSRRIQHVVKKLRAEQLAGSTATSSVRAGGS